MIEKLKHLLKAISFYLTSANSKGHGTHSPFVYQFITEVLNDDRHFYAYDELKPLLYELKKNKQIEKRTRDNILSEKCNKLLFRIVAFYNPECIIEIGSSLGITTAYLASPDKNITIQNLEENEQLTSIAKQTTEQLGLVNITIISPEKFFLSKENTLKKNNILLLINSLDADRDEFFERLVNTIEGDSIAIITGINKNLTNNIFWKKIKEQSMKTFSINLFEIGILFFRKDALKKQSFEVRF